MEKVIRVIIGVLIFLIIILSSFMYITGPVDKKNKDIIKVEVTNNDTFSTFGKVLYKKGLIKSEFIYKVYIKLFLKESHLEVGEYNLNKTMSLEKIMDELKKGNNYNPDNIRITFKEGLNIRQIAKEISKNTNNKYDDIIKLLEDKEFARKMINDYWFLDESILNDKIYYPLEGYLFPDTYEFLNKDVTTETIIRTLLNEFGEKLKPYQDKINENEFKLNEIVTLASIAEVESLPGSDRKKVVGVFVNRIKNNISLGSDMTAYYAYKLDDIKTGLTLNEFSNCSNPYNTRCTSKMGLPVGPISNPGLDSIIGAIDYEKSSYLYFVADCNGKTYFMNNYTEFESTIKKLMNQGLWCEVSA